jgi:type IV pilus assembly protein PilY1
LRSSAYNKIYYNPNLTYSPWSGLNFAGDEYTNAPVTAALSEPYYPERGSVNLTTNTNVTFRQYVDYDYDNRNWNWPITDDITWLARYYIWTDKNTGCPGNVAGVVDGTSPHLFPGGACTEGTLVEIKDPSTEYYKGTNRSDCEAEGFCTYTEELQNFANFYSYSRNRSLTAKTSISAAVTSSDNMRIGFGAFNQDTDNIQIAEMNESATEAGHKLDVLQRIHRLKTDGGTPIPSALEATGQYYSCAAINIIRPENFTECPISPAPEGNCQQNFTLVMTDGIWNGSTNKRSFTVDNDSDGLDANGGASPWDGGDRYSDNTSRTLADIAMYYYENDLDGIANNNEVPANERDLAGAAPSAFPGYPSNPTMHQHMSTFVITFGLEGTISENQVPDFGEVDNAFSWGSVNNDEGKLNDMLHTAINGRGAFLSAGDSAELTDALTNTFEAFSQANGTASAVSFNSQELIGDSVVFRAFYNIRENSGDLVAVPLIIDVENGKVSLDSQDWSAAQQLFRNKTHLTRNILTFDNQVTSGRGGIAFRANTLNDSQKLALSDNINPDSDPSAFAAQITKHVRYLRGDSSQEWPVGNLRKRARAANTDRDEDGNLITSNDEGPLGDIINSTPVFYGAPDRIRRSSPPYPTSPGETYEEFKTAEKDRPAVVYVGSNDGLLHGFSAATGDEVFAYMPGLIIDGFYSERVKNLLSTNYAHRYTVDLSAAINDAYLDADRDNVTHTAEARMDWTTVLIGGFRGGAKGYFALDVTDPTAMVEGNTEVSGQVTKGPKKVVMWEFTDADDIHPLDGDGNVATDQNLQPASDLGYTYSQPTIAMSNVEYQGDISDNANKRWISIFGNGYNSSGGNASLFGTFIDGGTDGTWCHPAKPEAERCDAAGRDPGTHDFVKLEPVVTGLPAGFANGMGEPRGIDIDSNGTLDIAYAGDRLGNLYRFDLRNPDPALWSVSNIFTARYFAPDGSGAVPQPITTQPLVIVHPTVQTGVDCGTDFDAQGNLISRTCGGFIVAFATGSYLYDGDDTSREVQGMYGIWDKLGSAIDSTFDADGNYNVLVKQEYTAINTVIDTETTTETTDPVTGVVTTSTTTVSNNVSTRTLSENTVDYGNKRGWYLSFDHAAAGGLTPNTPQYPGEKAVRNLQSRGGIAFVNSIIPKENLSCGVRSGGAANAFCADTGTLRCVTAAGVFDINDDGLVNDFDLAAGSRAIIASTFFEDSVPTDSTFISGARVTQLGKDVLDVRLTKTSDGKNTGRISWQRLKED